MVGQELVPKMGCPDKWRRTFKPAVRFLVVSFSCMLATVVQLAVVVAVCIVTGRIDGCLAPHTTKAVLYKTRPHGEAGSWV